MTKNVYVTIFLTLSFFSVDWIVNGQQPVKRDSKKDVYLPGYEYDARTFLSQTQKIAFKRRYPEFDELRAEKNWEWKDVDPLGLFTPKENRRRRRELFLYEYSSTAINQPGSRLSDEQSRFRSVLLSQFEGSVILISKDDIKLSVPYTDSYEKDLPARGLLEKIAYLGLQWAQAGGTNLYIYNGPILLAKYKAGYVSLASPNIDRPMEKVKIHSK
jgi:hypothetical protein